MLNINFNDFVYYCADSPTGLRWKINMANNRYKRNSVAGSANTVDKYCVLYINRKLYRTHRIVWELHNGKIPKGMQIDHINGVRSDNRIENLRIVTNKINSQNRGKRSSNTSGVTGVYFQTVKSGNKTYHYWVAQWYGVCGKIFSKAFSVYKMGNDTAFKRAWDYRLSAISQLNEKGGNYTDRHGT